MGAAEPEPSSSKPEPIEEEPRRPVSGIQRVRFHVVAPPSRPVPSSPAVVCRVLWRRFFLSRERNLDSAKEFARVRGRVRGPLLLASMDVRDGCQ